MWEPIDGVDDDLGDASDDGAPDPESVKHSWLAFCSDFWLEFSLDLNHFLDDHEAPNGFALRCQACLAALQDACVAVFSKPEFKVAPFDWTPEVHLEQFGSTVQGTEVKDSDLDVRITFAQFAVHGKDRQARYLQSLAKEPGEFEVVRVLISASLPLLTLRFRDVLVDVTMGGELVGGAEVDITVRELLDTVGVGARCFVRLVKVFGKKHGLINAYGGYLNSISWILLAVAYLQTEGCLPRCEELAMDEDTKRRRLWPVQLTPAFLARFFFFVEELGVQDGLVHHVSVCRSRGDGPVHYAVPKEDVRSNWCLVVEHPSLPERNLVSCLRQDAWIRTVKVCAWGRTVCEGSGESVSELFRADRSDWYQPRKRRRIRHRHMDETDGG